MNLLPMHYYIAVVQAQSISRAAASLFITQQTLSAHIAALERELGVQLFTRRPAFRLTWAGERFYHYCLQFQRLQTAMEAEFRDLALAGSGQLRVGISQTRSLILMPPVLARLRESHPQLQVRLCEQTNEELIQRLEKGELDVVVADVSEDRPEFCTRPYYRESLLLAAPQGMLSPEALDALRHSGDLSGLGAFPFVMNTQNDIAGRYGAVLLEKAGVVPKVSVLSDSAETCLRLCRDGFGLYLCPDLYVDFFTAFRDQLLCLPLPLSYPIRIAWRNGAYTKDGIEAFLDACLHPQKPPVASPCDFEYNRHR